MRTLNKIHAIASPARCEALSRDDSPLFCFVVEPLQISGNTATSTSYLQEVFRIGTVPAHTVATHPIAVFAIYPGRGVSRTPIELPRFSVGTYNLHPFLSAHSNSPAPGGPIECFQMLSSVSLSKNSIFTSCDECLAHGSQK